MARYFLDVNWVGFLVRSSKRLTSTTSLVFLFQYIFQIKLCHDIFFSQKKKIFRILLMLLLTARAIYLSSEGFANLSSSPGEHMRMV